MLQSALMTLVQQDVEPIVFAKLLYDLVSDVIDETFIVHDVKSSDP